MSVKPYTKWALLSVPLIVTVFSAGSRGIASAGNASNPGEFTQHVDLAAQVETDIRNAIFRHEAADSQSEWATSGYTPADVFGNLRALGKDKAEIPQALCAQLTALADTDLVLFEEEIRSQENSALLPCAEILSERVDAFWHDNTRDMKRMLNKKRQKAVGALPLPATLRSLEKEVDLAGTPVFFNADLGPNQIAITFDDGPHPTRTNEVLQILKDYGVRATFFEMGAHVKNVPDITRAQAAAGHAIGSHTMTHPELPKLARTSMPQAQDEITDAQELLEDLLGMPAPFFRFPYGARTAALQSFVKEKGLATFFWNMDSLDWKIKDPKALLANVIQEMDREKNSGIMLFHDIHQQTVLTLPLVLEEMRVRRISTVVFVSKGP